MANEVRYVDLESRRGWEDERVEEEGNPDAQTDKGGGIGANTPESNEFNVRGDYKIHKEGLWFRSWGNF
jgi:hypothetical protein